MNRMTTPCLTATDRNILGILFQAYPDYLGSEDFFARLSNFPDARKESSYLIEKMLIRKRAVPSVSIAKRLLQVFERLTESDQYLSYGYEITVSGIDAFRQDYNDRGVQPKTKEPPKQLSEVKSPKICLHKRTKLIEIKQKSTLNLKAGISSTGAERAKTDYIGIYQCQLCKRLFSEDVKEHVRL